MRIGPVISECACSPFFCGNQRALHVSLFFPVGYVSVPEQDLISFLHTVPSHSFSTAASSVEPKLFHLALEAWSIYPLLVYFAHSWHHHKFLYCLSLRVLGSFVKSTISASCSQRGMLWKALVVKVWKSQVYINDIRSLQTSCRSLSPCQATGEAWHTSSPLCCPS